MMGHIYAHGVSLTFGYQVIFIEVDFFFFLYSGYNSKHTNSKLFIRELTVI